MNAKWDFELYADEMDARDTFERFVTRERKQREAKRMSADTTAVKHEDNKRLARKVKQVYAEKAVDLAY